MIGRRTIEPFRIQADPFSEAVAHHRAGRLDVAAKLYRSILAGNPQHADSLNLLGVIAHQQGQGLQAVDLIQRAIQIDANRPAYHVNLATAFRGLGRHDEAVKSCRTALELQADLTEARLCLGLSLQATKQWSEAEQQLRWLAENHPQDSRGPQALANCLREQGRTNEAVTHYRDALARNAGDAAAHLGLGTLLLTDKNPWKAEPHLRRATELLPGVATAWMNFGACLMKTGREREAVPVFQRALELAPNDLELGVNLGQAWLASGNRSAAENCFKAVLSFNASFPEALNGLADAHLAGDRPEEAIPLYERAQHLDARGGSYKGLSDALWESGDVDRAVAVVRDGIARHPDDAENHLRLATMLASGGDLEGAVASCRTALQIRPGYPPALVKLAQTLRAKLPAADRELLERTLQHPGSEFMRAGLHFGLAQVADACGDFSQAAAHLRLSNSLAKTYREAHNQRYDAGEYDRYIDRMVEVFTPEFFTKVDGFGLADERPVFVVGMPRSGTTLIEQILASHPQVFGAGERRFAFQSLAAVAIELGRPGEPLECLDRLSREAVQRCANWHLEQLHLLDGGRSRRVVDKMPENYTLLGWLAVQFPKARFIHCRRDLRDIALSCWMTDFARIRWANDLEHIGGRIRNYRRMMEHWRRVLPVTMLEVDYERLVADQEGQSKRMVEWLGLDWDPACLDFYRSERLVKTASVTQVRQPVYTRSAGRWKHYQEALQPFLRTMDREG